MAVRRAVAAANADLITGGDPRRRVPFAQRNPLQQYQSLQQFLGFLGGDPETLQTYQPQLASLQLQLSEPQVLGESLLNQMVQEVLIREEAQARGIQVAPADIDRSFEEAFGFFPEGTPTPEPVPRAR